MTRNNLKTKFHSGFTLVEILVALAIIGLIMGIATISFGMIRQKSRDIKRLKDINSVQAALQMYFYNEGQYPDAITFGSTLTGSSSSSTYMAILPQNPTPKNDGICPNNEYSYQTTATSTSYRVDFCLSTAVGNTAAGKKCATPQGILNQSCCSLPFTYGGVTYTGVEIGDQCWMTENLNIGDMILDSASATDNGIIEKYCGNDNIDNCTNNGGLYPWDEAMGYVETDGAQGICPNGWHLPTDAEEYTLENYLTDSPNTCDAARLLAWDCANAGEDLRTGDFGANFSGYRGMNGLFYDQSGESAFWWSSSLHVSSPFSRMLYPANTAVYRYDGDAWGAGGRLYGWGVRCIKN